MAPPLKVPTSCHLHPAPPLKPQTAHLVKVASKDPVHTVPVVGGGGVGAGSGVDRKMVVQEK